MRQTTEFIADCLHFLRLEKPVDFGVGDVISDWDAHYYNEERRHVVRVHNKPVRCKLSLIAHELVHASLEETNPGAKDHGRKFRQRAEALEKHLRRIGWELHDKIFIKGVDV